MELADNDDRSILSLLAQSGLLQIGLLQIGGRRQRTSGIYPPLSRYLIYPLSGILPQGKFALNFCWNKALNQQQAQFSTDQLLPP
jgi:hypothetical protein